MGQGVASSGLHAVDTSDTSADDSEASHTRRRVQSKRAYKMIKVWGADEVGWFFVTGGTDAAGQPSHFYCSNCSKDVSVFTHGPHEVLRHFQGVEILGSDQRLRLETPGWRVLDFERNHLIRMSLRVRESAFFEVFRSLRVKSSLSLSIYYCGQFWSLGCQVTSRC